MSEPSLTPRDRAVLMALMAVGEEIANPVLKQRVGIELDKPCRVRLNELKLVASRQGARGTYVHELTDDGWAWCRAELGQAYPAGTRDAGIRVLYVVMAGLGRYLDRSSVPLSEMFGPDRELRPDLLTNNEALETKIRLIYNSLAATPGDWVSLADIQDHLIEVAKPQMDEALRNLSGDMDVTLARNPDQGLLTPADRAAAVRLGGNEKHLISIHAL